MYDKNGIKLLKNVCNCILSIKNYFLLFYNCSKTKFNNPCSTIKIGCFILRYFVLAINFHLA